MRVALDVTPLLGAGSGVAQTVSQLLAALPGAAPEVEIVPYVLSGRARAGSATLAGLPPGTRALPLPAGAVVRAWGRLDRPRGDRWLGDADVVHGANFVVPPMSRRPTTLTVHDCWCARHPEACAPAVRAATAAVQRAVDRGAWVHASTDHVAREVRDVYGAERLVVVPFGVPPVAEVPPSPPGPPTIVSLATLDPRKGLDGLVRAFGALVASGAPGVPDDLRLVLAGADDAGRPAVDEAVAGLDPAVAARVDLPGAVSDARRAALLRGAAVLAYPSLDEGFGFPLLEAMSVGTPVVASSAGAIPEVAGDAAELVAPGDDAALAAALARVLGDDAHRSTLVAAGRARAASYSWAHHAAGMAALWREAVAA
ncbi:MAG TPA: glycosyltransferase family 1 protein [Acidimicrobiales bacterium]|nr:glycosyltransferase family 1 protein [Acidimicrobiales bacterium]